MKVSFEKEFNGEFIEEGKIDLFYKIMSGVVVYVIGRFEEEVKENENENVEENQYGNNNGDINMRIAREKQAKMKVNHRAGSGVVIKPGLVLTAAHVIKDAVGVTIRYLEDTDYYACDVIKLDGQLDLALIKKKSCVGNKKHVKFGSFDDVREGGQVLTIAHPRSFEYSFTMGNIAHPHRWLSNANVPGNATYPFIQINNINMHNQQGSSGGPVFNPAGLLIGINVFGSEGYDFATHIDSVKDFVKGAKEYPLELEIERVQRRSNVGFIAGKKKKKKKLAKRVPNQDKSSKTRVPYGGIAN